MLNIKLDNITRSFGERQVVKGLSFEVKKNTIHGLLGPNGAGKTTTLRMICGQLPMSSGRIFFDNEEPNFDSVGFKQSFGALIEEPALYDDMSVVSFLRFLASLYKVKNITEAISITLNKLNLEEVKSRLIGNLSKGYRQRVAIAGAIIHSPKLLILDEPTVGLDVEARKDMRRLIKDLSKEHTIILSSHIMHEMQELCDDVTLLDQGKKLLTKSVEDLLIDEKTLTLELESLPEEKLEALKTSLTNLDIELLSLKQSTRSLEDVFIEKIRESR